MSNWAEQELASSNIGDKRLDTRYKKILNAIYAKIGNSFPSIFEKSSELIATYRFLSNKKIDYQTLLAPHMLRTKERISEDDVILCVQDTSSFDFTSKRSSEDMGHLEHWKRRGLLLHLTLAISPNRVNKGIIALKVWTRDIKTMGKRHYRKELPIEAKESYRWIESYQQVQALAKTMPDKQFICIGDRENDIYEAFVANAEAEEENIDILIRSRHNRRLSEEFGGKKMLETIKKTKALGKVEISIPSRAGRKKRKAILEVRTQKIILKGLSRQDRQLPEVELTMIQAKEKSKNQKKSKIEWNLLTSIEANDLSSCIKIIDYYRSRWEIEIFFKILKSGSKIETLHLEKFDRLQRALAIYLIMSWRIHYIMMLSREYPKILAKEVFDEMEIKIIYIMRGKKLPKRPPRLGVVAQLLAETGGYLARKNDPPPGPKAFWQGFKELIRSAFIFYKLQTYV